MDSAEAPDVSAIRRKTKLTQKRFARAIGIPTETLQSWERNRREPSASAVTLLRVAEALVDGLSNSRERS